MNNILKIMLVMLFLVVGVVALTNFDNEPKQTAKPDSTPNITANPSQAVGQPTAKPVTIVTFTLVSPPHRTIDPLISPIPFL